MQLRLPPLRTSCAIRRPLLNRCTIGISVIATGGGVIAAATAGMPTMVIAPAFSLALEADGAIGAATIASTVTAAGTNAAGTNVDGPAPAATLTKPRFGLAWRIRGPADHPSVGPLALDRFFLRLLASHVVSELRFTAHRRETAPKRVRAVKIPSGRNFASGPACSR